VCHVHLISAPFMHCVHLIRSAEGFALQCCSFNLYTVYSSTIKNRRDPNDVSFNNYLSNITIN